MLHAFIKYAKSKIEPLNLATPVTDFRPLSWRPCLSIYELSASLLLGSRSRASTRKMKAWRSLAGDASMSDTPASWSAADEYNYIGVARRDVASCSWANPSGQHLAKENPSCAGPPDARASSTKHHSSNASCQVPSRRILAIIIPATSCGRSSTKTISSILTFSPSEGLWISWLKDHTHPCSL